MIAIKGVAHFSIPVSDVATSTRFYTEIVGCTHLSTVPSGHMAFLDAAGTCLILVKRDPPINRVLDDHGGVHHSFAIAHEEYKAALDHLRAHWSRDYV
jgi:catechol 2,3-dioxygenase-like lactoylglutathione lyase family enzyme